MQMIVYVININGQCDCMSGAVFWFVYLSSVMCYVNLKVSNRRFLIV